ncbi:MAG: response regulator [Bacteroidota bacterium]
MKSVLLVDDDPSFTFAAQVLFKHNVEPVELEICHHGEQAIERFARIKPDLMLLDINMPEMNGWEVLEQLSVDDNSFTLYILSSSIDRHDLERAKNHPLVTNYLSKPLTGELVERMLGR